MSAEENYPLSRELHDEAHAEARRYEPEDFPPLVRETERYLSGFSGNADFMTGAARAYRLKQYLRMGAPYPAAVRASIHWTLKHPWVRPPRPRR